MAKLTAVRGFNKQGTIIAGYRVALPKVELERNGFKEGDELDVKISKGTIRITKKE